MTHSRTAQFHAIDRSDAAIDATWEQVATAGPDLLVIAACGFDAEEAARRAAHLDLERIAPNARVVVVDGDAYYSRPGPRLADGVRQLGHLLQPHAVEDPGLPLIELRLRAVAGR
jgi:iron complex transport system substrate-binding protein